MTKKHFHVLFLAILLLALLLRFWQYPSWFGFDYDQEINAWIAKSIVIDHKPVLIGPETSVGGMYVGPYFNYLIALFFFLGKMSPMATISLNIIVAAATTSIIYLAGTKIFSPLAGLFSAIIYGFSYVLVNYDRVLWNPLPLPFVSVGVVLFLWLYFQNRRWRDLILAAVLAGFSLHLHFIALFILAFFALALVIYGGRDFWTDGEKIVSLLLVFGFFVFPLVLFDLRHGFLNSRHFWQFFFATKTAGGAMIDLWSFWRIISIFVGLVKAVFYSQSNFAFFTNSLMALLLLAGVAVIVKNFRRTQQIFKLTLLFFLVPLIGLSFYQGPLPSYYFLPEFAIFVLLAGGVLGHFSSRNKLASIIVITFLFIFALTNCLEALRDNNGLALVYKQQAVDKIVGDAAGRSFKVDFITDRGLKTGFRYLFWLKGNKLIEDMSVPTQKTYKIVIPYYFVSAREITATYGAIGVIIK